MKMEQQNVNKNPFAFEINNSKQKLQKFFNKVKYFERNYPEHNFRKSSFRGTFEENQRLPDDDFLKHSRNNRFRGNVIDKKKQNVFENGMNTLKKRKRRKKKKQKDICHGSFQDGQDNSFETSTIHSQKYRSPKKKQSNECPKNSHNNSFSAESTIIPTTYFGNDSVRISNCCANDKASSNLNNENCKKRRRKKQRDKECNTVDECTHSNETNRAENDKQVVLNGCESSVKKKHDTDLFYFDICGNKADKYVPVSVSKDVEDRLNILKKNFNQVNNDYKRKNFSNTVDTNTVQAIEYRKKSITNESYISQILDTNNTLKKQNSSVESINISGNDGYLSSSSNSTLYKKIKQSRGRINKEKISNSKKFEYDTTCGFTHNKPTLEQVTSKQKDENKNVKEYSYFNFASNKIKNVAEHIYDKNDIPLEIDLESVHTKQIETVNGTEGNEEENIYCKKIKKRKRRHENYVNGKESDCDISTKHSIQKNNMKDRNDFLGSEEMSKSVENMQRIFKVPNQVKKKNRNKTSDTVNISESECEIIDTSSSKKKKKHKTKTKESDIQKCCFQDNNNVEDLLDNLTNINQDNTSESDGITAKSFNTKKKKSKPLQTESNISKKSVTCEKDIDDIHYKKCSDLGNTITPEKNQCLGNSFKAYKNHKLNRDSVENEGNSLTIIEPKIYKISQVEEAEINKGNKKIKDNDFHIVTNISESECEIVNTLNLKKKKKHKIINIQLGSNNTPKKNLKQNTNKCINLDNHLQEVLGKIKDTSNETNIDDCKFVKNKNKKHKPSRTENGPLKDIEDMEFTEKRLLNDVFDGLKNYELVCKDPVENGGGRIQNENYKVSQSTETKAREINKEIKARRIDTLTNGCDMDSVNSSSKKKRKLVTSTESNAYDAPKKKHKTKKVKNDNNSNIKNISDTSHIALRSDSDEVTLFDKVRKMKKKKLKTLQTVDIVLDHSECQITSRSELDEITLTDELPKKKFKAMQTVDSVLNHPEDQITSRSESDEITLIDELPKIKKKLKTLYTEDNVLEHRAGQMTSRGESHEITLIDELPKMKKKKLKTLQTEDNVLGHLEGQITSRSKADEITLIDKLPKIKNKKFKTLPTEDSVLDHSEGQKTLRSEPDEITLIDELPKIKKKKLKTMQTVDSVLDHSEDQITSRSESDEITLIDELPKMKNKKLKTLHTEDNVLEYHAGQMTSRNDSDEITFIDELPMLKKKKLKTLHTEDSVFDHSEGQITLITLIDGLPKMKKKKIKTLCTEDIVLDHPEGQLTSRNESDEITLTDELPKVKKKKVKTLQSEDSILDHLKEQEISLMEKVNNPRDCVELNVAKSLKKKYIVDDVLEQNGSILLENSSLTNDQNSDSSEIIIPEWKSVRHKEHFTQADEKDTKNSISIDDTLLLSENYDKCYIDKLNPKTETRFDNVENKEDDEEYIHKSENESNVSNIFHQKKEESTCKDIESLEDKGNDETKKNSSKTEIFLSSEPENMQNTISENESTREEIKKLRNLHIILPFTVPALHALATRTTTPTKQQTETIQNKNIPVKTGPFSKEEDEKIMENWKQLCKEYDLRMTPSLFIKFPRKMKMEIKVNILRYIAHGLDNRLLHRVHIRFKHLLQKQHIKMGRFTPQEDKTILEFMKNTSSSRPFKNLSELLGRTSLSVEKRYDRLTSSDNKIIHWTPPMVDRFIKALMKITKCEKLKKLKHREFTIKEWKKLSKKIDNIPIMKLQRAWRVTIYPRLFSKEGNLRDMKVKIIQILCDKNNTDWRTVDWKEVAQNFRGFTADKIYMMFKHLIYFHVPKEIHSDLKECLDFLKKKFLTYDDKIPPTHKFKKFVVNDGHITYESSDSD